MDGAPEGVGAGWEPANVDRVLPDGIDLAHEQPIIERDFADAPGDAGGDGDAMFHDLDAVRPLVVLLVEVDVPDLVGRPANVV